ncbi:NLR family CARD domain-containing protein 4-like [Asterias rubens]|uniref:NLR family CARD domain-containing protein 4-like n=1 Tax=Asterias rubens TaxID=7604 RepID=UPI001455224B|nr:NLR family CARD domain-containing protein 4-like [Asterias rubens]
MADQSEETMEEEEMARQSQESEQRSMAVVGNIQPSPESRDLVRAENVQMLQAHNPASQSLSLHRIEGSGNLAVANPSHCTFNIVQLKPGTTAEDILPALQKLTASSKQKRTLDSAVKPTGSEQEYTPTNIQKVDDSPQAAASGASRQPKTSDDVSLQGAHPTKDPAQVAAESCRVAIRTHYRNTGSYVELIPREEDDTKHIKEIFTELTLEKSGEKLESYKDMFDESTPDGDSIKQVILKGEPGRGKSTLIDKMAYDWACDEALQQFELVFVLKMNAVEQSTELIVSIFEQLLAEDTKIDPVALDYYIRDNEEKVLILLDGFDELMTPMHDLKETSFGSILKILNRKKGRECSVVITTRTSHYDKLVTKSLIRKPFTQVIVEGFDQKDIEKYVRKFYSEAYDKAESLILKITSSNVLSDLAKSPMLLLLLCILWRDNSTLPETMSRIYSEALEYIFHRKTDMSPDETPKVLNELGKIALRGLLAPKQQLAFPEDDFEPSVLESALKAGILTRQKVLKGIESHNSIQFLHKTFQEFFAGKYLQSLLETDTVEFKKNLKQMINSGGNDYGLRFCAGDNMACTNGILQTLSESDQFKREQQGGDKYSRLMRLGLDCYFEGQSKDLPLVEFIESVLTDKVVIYDWNRDSLNSLTNFLRNVHTHTVENKHTDYLDKVQSIRIRCCDFGGCMSDVAHGLSLMVNLSSLILERCTLTDSSEEYVTSGASLFQFGSAATCFKKMKNIQQLSISKSKLTGKAMTHIIPVLCDLPNLVKLNLEGNTDLGGSVALWVDHFNKMKNLQKLDLGLCNLTGEDMTHIVLALCDLRNLVELHLSSNEALGGSAALWVDHFKKMKNLKIIGFSFCKLTGKDMTHIAPAMCHLPNLVELNLGGNNTLGAAVLWAHHLKKMKDLQKLVLNYCKLTDKDLKYTARALCDLPNLVELNIGRNEGLSGSAALWANLFKRMKNLKKLDLSYCKLTGKDMTHIAPALCHLPNLVELNLWKNNEFGGSAASWAHHFKKMNNLQKLVLTFCKLTGEDMTHIAHALCDLPNLVELNLGGNHTLSDAASWAHHFKKMKKLKKLLLGDCLLSYKDMIHFAPALCDLPNLVELNLARNLFDGSAALWAHHFKKMKNLTKLDLRYCLFTDEDNTHIDLALCDLPNLVTKR